MAVSLSLLSRATRHSAPRPRVTVASVSSGHGALLGALCSVLLLCCQLSCWAAAHRPLASSAAAVGSRMAAGGCCCTVHNARKPAIPHLAHHSSTPCYSILQSLGVLPLLSLCCSYPTLNSSPSCPPSRCRLPPCLLARFLSRSMARRQHRRHAALPPLWTSALAPCSHTSATAPLQAPQTTALHWAPRWTQPCSATRISANRSR